MNVEDLMSDLLIACGPEDTLDIAMQLMRDNEIGFLPVTDTNLRVIGVLTDRDVAVAASLEDVPLSQIRARDAMTPGTVECTLGEDILVAQERMRTARVHRLPVTSSEGRLVGVLSLDDMAYRLSESPGDGGLTAQQIARTLRDLCAPKPLAPA